MDTAFDARLHRVALRVAWQVMLAYRRLLRPRTQGACVLVWSGDGLLLVRHSYKPGYGVPAGMIGRGETPADAAARELREEVGIQVSPDALRHAGSALSREYGNEDHLHFFELRLDVEPAVRVDGREIVWAGFHTREEALRLDLLEAVRDQLQRRQGTDSTV
jgi:8-oxo-dGTP pyrophosphatase MutT (NUDIX family)